MNLFDWPVRAVWREEVDCLSFQRGAQNPPQLAESVAENPLQGHPQSLAVVVEVAVEFVWMGAMMIPSTWRSTRTLR